MTGRLVPAKVRSSLIGAHVPVKEMFGHICSLRALTSGRAQFSVQFHHYALALANV
jgi:elongation factor G